MSTQVQIRGATQATQEARTLAARELDINTTDARIAVHNGSTAGGVPHANCFDTQNNEWSYSSASGTNTITITLAIAPSSYRAGQTFTFMAASTNTGSATLNVNSLGAMTLKKKNVGGGSLDTLSAGDIISGGIYTAHVLDSSNALLEGIGGGSITSVSQGDINTSTGTVSLLPNTLIATNFYRSSTVVTMPGGQYGFCPETKHGASDSGGIWLGNNANSYAQKAFTWDNANSAAVGAQQRYVTSSPPFNLGEGDATGFIFMLMDGNRLIGHYAANVPPWAYNGPTDIRGKYCQVRKKKFQKIIKKRTLEEIIDGAPIELIEREVTHEIKNADMGIIPHPFDNTSHKIILLDPMCEKVGRLIDHQNNGGGDEIVDAILKGQIYPDNDQLNRKGPPGVMQARLIFKR